MKFLIDECLSPSLATMARMHGCPESTHVAWLGLRSCQDWALVQRATEYGYATVTNNSADFITLLERVPDHPGLVCIDVAHGLMSLDVQQRLFEYALAQIGGTDLSGRIVRVALAADRSVRFEIHSSGTA
ncbi:MAG: toxin-antitoxin system, toxin component, PIN family protein [Boseongicola sp. SB0673_bin_14]|nr:toxin-antitoxin system, toxin component, PIN family protein [Boseongicola sp. SB0667_bin_21]MYI69475.1 toxin-antitoxin system, toxin component, PIN family protein [Boseongicola sp. SB0673_bin_14]